MSLRVTFLGTSGAVPTTERNPSAIFLRREGDAFLFDVGEGTQRQMMRFHTGFDVEAIFLSHIHGDHVLGLPGLIQTMDFNEREGPLSIFTPRGTRSAVVDLIHAVGNDPSFPVAVREVEGGDVVLDRADYRIEAVATDHLTPSVGYALVEDERKGRFDRERAEELGVPVGPKFSELHEGNPVTLEDGTVVRPEEVVGPPRPGRSIVYSGDTRPVDAIATVVAEADVLVHDATFTSEARDRALETAHSTAAEAGEVAARAGAKRLVLTHISSRYAGNTGTLKEEAQETFDGRVIVATDGYEIDVPYPDSEH